MLEFFSQRLQYLIDSKKIKNADLARGLGKHPARVTDWLNGKIENPHRDTIVKISDFFGCDFDWLMDGIGEPYPDKIAARITPGTKKKSAEMVEINNSPVNTDVNLRIIVGWMNEYFAGDPEQSANFLETMKNDWPGLQAYVDRIGRPEKAGDTDLKNEAC